MTPNVPIENDDIRLRELFEHVKEGGVVQLTRDGRLAAAVVDRESYDQLLLAAGQDARLELKEMAAETRKRIAEAGLERDLVDEAIEGVRSQRR